MTSRWRRDGAVLELVAAGELDGSQEVVVVGVGLARARGAVRQYVDRAASGAPEAWVLAARRRTDVPEDRMADALDSAVARTAVLPSRPPVWWRVTGVVQWALLAAAGIGGLWLAVLAGAGYLRVPAPEPPSWGDVPIPTDRKSVV